MKIISLEPLKTEWLDAIEKKTGERLVCIDRKNIERNKLKHAEILICRDRDLTQDLINNCRQIGWIFIVSTGVDRLPFDILKEKGIQVVNSPNVSDEAMSDYTIGAMLLFSCRFKQLLQCQSEHYWKPYAMTEPLQGKKLLIVGAGKIGVAIANKAKVFGMEIYGICREAKQLENFEDVCSMECIESLCQMADYIVCTLPLTAETKYLFDEKIFRKMKRTAIFINISRGGLVNISDLIICLKEECFAGAVLDVFEKEPLSAENELWDLENVVITPHSSGRIENYLEQALNIFIRNLCEYKKTGRLPNAIDLEKGY